MAEKLQLKLITPEATVFEEAVDEVRLPTLQGQIAILPEHAALVTVLAPGEMLVKSGEVTSPLAITGGVVEIFDNTLIILADSAEHAHTINVAAAETKARELAKQLESEAELDLTSYSLLQRNLEIERIKIEIGKKWKR